MIGEHDMALMMSIAYTAPYLDIECVTLISDRDVFRLIDMHSDEVKEYVKSNGVKVLPAKDIQEEAYALCNETLVHIGLFYGGFIPSHHILLLKKLCSKMIMLHTHPVPLPIPTLEDVVSMYQIGYRIECVLSRMTSSLAKMVCVEPLRELEDIMLDMDIFEERLYSLVDRYVVVEDESGIRFIPYPSTERVSKIEKEFIDIMGNSCRFGLVLLYMDKGEYEYKVV